MWPARFAAGLCGVLSAGARFARRRSVPRVARSRRRALRGATLGRGAFRSRRDARAAAGALCRRPLALRLARQKQGRRALRQACERRGNVDRAACRFPLPIVRRWAAGPRPAASAMVSMIRCLNFAMRSVLTASTRRQVHRFDDLPRGALDGAQHVALARRDEQDGLALAPGPAGAADAMHVGLGVVGHVVVHDMPDAFDIQAAGGDIGGDQDVDLPRLQARHRAFAQRLRNVAVERRGGEAARLAAFPPAPPSTAWCG